MPRSIIASPTNAVNPSYTLCTRPYLTLTEKVELTGYLVRSSPLFQEARQHASTVYRNHEERSLRQILDLTVSLVDQCGDGQLPPNLESLFRSELDSIERAYPDQSALVNEARGHLPAFFALPQAAVDQLLPRGRELLERLILEVSVAPLLQDFASGELGVLTAASIQELMLEAGRRLDQLNHQQDTLTMVSTADFLARSSTHTWLIDGVLVADQPAVIGGPQKTLKTSTMIDLAVSISLGPPDRFLGHFDVRNQRRVGVFSGESGEVAIKDCLHRVCRSKHVDPATCDIFWSCEIPRIGKTEDLLALAAQIRRLGLGVVILDPLYLSLCAGGTNVSAANLFEVGPLLAAFAKTCIDEGATPVLVHHFRKPMHMATYAKPELEDLAFAGAGQFARQWMLLGKRQKFVPEEGIHRLWLSLGGSANFASDWAVNVEEGPLNTLSTVRRWQPTLRSISEELDEREQRKTESKQATKDAQDLDDQNRMINTLRLFPDGDSRTALAAASGLPKARANTVISRFIDARYLMSVQVTKAAGPGSRAYAGYRYVGPGRLESPVGSEMYFVPPMPPRTPVPDESSDQAAV